MQCIMHVVVEIANARFWLNGLVLDKLAFIYLFKVIQILNGGRRGRSNVSERMM